MSEEHDTARRYRLHAEELRMIAENMDAADTRDAVLEVAKDYERMAKSLDAMGASKAAHLH